MKTSIFEAGDLQDYFARPILSVNIYYIPASKKLAFWVGEIEDTRLVITKRPYIVTKQDLKVSSCKEVDQGTLFYQTLDIKTEWDKARSNFAVRITDSNPEQLPSSLAKSKSSSGPKAQKNY